MAGIGVVIRNSSGQVIGALSNRINLPLAIDDVEAIAYRSNFLCSGARRRGSGI